MDSRVKARGLGGFTRALWYRSKESALNKSYCCSLSGDTEGERRETEGEEGDKMNVHVLESVSSCAVVA